MTEQDCQDIAQAINYTWHVGTGTRPSSASESYCAHLGLYANDGDWTRLGYNKVPQDPTDPDSNFWNAFQLNPNTIVNVYCKYSSPPPSPPPPPPSPPSPPSSPPPPPLMYGICTDRADFAAHGNMTEQDCKDITQALNYTWGTPLDLRSTYLESVCVHVGPGGQGIIDGSPGNDKLVQFRQYNQLLIAMFDLYGAPPNAWITSYYCKYSSPPPPSLPSPPSSPPSPPSPPPPPPPPSPPTLPVLANGESCTNDDRCSSGNCPSGTCVPADYSQSGLDGTNCTQDHQCSGNQCIDQSCLRSQPKCVSCTGSGYGSCRKHNDAQMSCVDQDSSVGGPKCSILSNAPHGSFCSEDGHCASQTCTLKLDHPHQGYCAGGLHAGCGPRFGETTQSMGHCYGDSTDKVTTCAATAGATALQCFESTLPWILYGSCEFDAYGSYLRNRTSTFGPPLACSQMQGRQNTHDVFGEGALCYDVPTSAGCGLYYSLTNSYDLGADQMRLCYNAGTTNSSTTHCSSTNYTICAADSGSGM